MSRSIAKDILCGYLGQIVGFGNAANLEHLCSYLAESDSACGVGMAVIAVVTSGAELYPWQTDVFGEVFNRPGDLLTECVASEKILIVKDSAARGADGIWVVETRPIGKISTMMNIFRGLPYKSFAAHYDVEGETICIRAINVKSCTRNKKNED